MVPPPSTIRRLTPYTPPRTSRAVGQDELVTAVVPELPAGVEVTRAGNSDLQGILRLTGGHPVRPALRRVHQEPGVVGSECSGADKDEVDVGSYRVALEVLRVGQQEPVLTRAGIEVTVDRDGCGQQDVWARHANSRR